MFQGKKFSVNLHRLCLGKMLYRKTTLMQSKASFELFEMIHEKFLNENS